MTKMGSWAGTALLAVLLGCATTGGGEMAAGSTKKPLFERLGGQDALKAVVDDFINRAASDPRVSSFFAKTDPVHLKAEITEFLCEAAGGPCKYTGMSMADAHSGRGIKTEHWDAVAEDLVLTLEKFKVPEQEKNEVLALVGTLKEQIVAK